MRFVAGGIFDLLEGEKLGWKSEEVIRSGTSLAPLPGGRTADMVRLRFTVSGRDGGPDSAAFDRPAEIWRERRRIE